MTTAPKSFKELLLPQELETFYILPALRHALARELSSLGRKQSDIAALFGVTSSTISQYKSLKRGSLISFNTDVLNQIKTSATKINDRITYIKEVQHILNYLRHTNILCQIHHRLNNLPPLCQPQNVGCLPAPSSAPLPCKIDS